MGTNTTSSPDVMTALHAIRRLVRTLRTSAAEVERRTGLSSAQLFVLQLLSESDAESVNELAQRTVTDQSSVSVVVARLEARGLVSRTPAPEDARRTVVSITQAGRDLIAGSPSTVQTRLVFALERMPAEALRGLSHDISQIVALMGAAHEPATFLFEDDASGAR